MPTKKLTQLTVDRIAIPKAGRVETWDNQLPGFGLRVAASGHQSWVAMYRVGGKLQRFTIGTIDQYPNWRRKLPLSLDAFRTKDISHFRELLGERCSPHNSPG